MARLKTKWQQKDRQRGVGDLASVMSVNIWRISSEALLNLENEGFETVSHSQRLDIIAEFVIFLLHMVDRLLYERYDDEQRREFLTALARHLSSLVQDNRVDANGPGVYQGPFIDLLNARMDEYSECAYSPQEGPGFTLRRLVGERVRDRFGPRDRKWIPDYVIDVEVPKAMASLTQALDGVLGAGPRRRPPVPEGGVWGEG